MSWRGGGSTTQRFDQLVLACPVEFVDISFRGFSPPLAVAPREFVHWYVTVVRGRLRLTLTLTLTLTLGLPLTLPLPLPQTLTLTLTLIQPQPGGAARRALGAADVPQQALGRPAAPHG